MSVPRTAFIPAALLVIALLSLPYGYYTFLRIAVTGWALFLVWFEYEERSIFTPWLIGFALIVGLFNPIIPVHLDRDTWRIIDVAAAAFFGGYAVRKG